MKVNHPGLFILSWFVFGLLMLEYGVQNIANAVIIVVGIMGLHKILISYRGKII